MGLYPQISPRLSQSDNDVYIHVSNNQKSEILRSFLKQYTMLRARAISPGLNGKRVTKRSSRHTQNSVASLRAEIRDTGKKPVHVLRTTARRPLADETPQGRAVGTRRPRLCAATQLALRGQERALTKKDGKRKACLFRRRARCPTSCFVGGRASPSCSCF